MQSWKSKINTDQTQWLLEPDNPSVRYITLTEIFGKKDSDKDVINAKQEIMTSGTVPLLLSKQNEDGYWEAPKAFYTAKYTGTVWQLLILAELGADGKNKRIQKACEFILRHSQDHESNGFSINTSAKAGGGRHSEVIPCLTGNMVWALIKLGYLNDERVQKAIDWIVTYQRFDDGDGKAPEGWPYDKYEMCWGKHSCHMGVVKALKALSEIPETDRSKDVRKTMSAGVEYMLAHHIYKKSHALSSVSKPGWMRFGFPLMYQTDVLEILLVLTKLGCTDKRMQEAVDLVIAKQDKGGTWKMESGYNDRFQTKIERKGELSKWITLNAMRVLKRYFK